MPKTYGIDNVTMMGSKQDEKMKRNFVHEHKLTKVFMASINKTILAQISNNESSKEMYD